MDDQSEAFLNRLESRLARIERTTGLSASVLLEVKTAVGSVLEAIGNLTPIIVAVHEACTAEHPPSPLIEPLNQLAVVIGDQTTQLVARLEELVAAVREQPEAMRVVIQQELSYASNPNPLKP